MSDFQNEMNRVVQGFVAQITELARRAAIDTLESAFGGRAARGAAPAAVSERFSSFVKASPGLRIEQINKQLGTTTKDLALPIRKLISEGAISAKGQKRSTTYFPGKKKAKS
jgi:hypothetical protein